MTVCVQTALITSVNWVGRFKNTNSQHQMKRLQKASITTRKIKSGYSPNYTITSEDTAVKMDADIVCMDIKDQDKDSLQSKIRTYFNWSGGKDSTLALHYLLEQKTHNIDLLLTTVNPKFNRVSMHGVRREVLEAQARSIGIQLEVLEVPEDLTMQQYDKKMSDKIQELRSHNYTHTVFGDIFLEDLRQYREKMLFPHGIKPVFPLWKKNTHMLIKDFLRLGYRSIIVCINTSKLDGSFLGMELSEDLIEKLPEDVDPCGENGEFHTLCFDGPIFNKPLDVFVGQKVFRTYKEPSGQNESIIFGFCDVIVKN